MKVVAMIPARYASTRFPGKMLKKLGDKTVIAQTYEAAVNSSLFDEVYVVTDSKEIAKEIRRMKGKALISKKEHACGTDRIAEFAGRIDADIFINIQGDEPFIKKEQLQPLIDVFEKDKDKKIDIASLMFKTFDYDEFINPNNVKVVITKEEIALYFSRAPIPYPRDDEFDYAYKHIGVYAFRKKTLMQIAKLPQTKIEQIEKLENLRFLEYGFRIKMVKTKLVNFGIDTPEDLEYANIYLNKMKDQI